MGQFVGTIQRAAVLALVVTSLSSLGASAANTPDPWHLAQVSLVAPGPSTSSLNAVSCIAATCVAVGSTFASGGLNQWGAIAVAVEHGGHWTERALDQGPLLSYPPPELSSVSCTSATHCVAVGTDGTHPLAATLDGTTWSVSDLPGPPDGWLSSVSCWQDGCTAVGVGDVPPTGGPLVETLVGGVWSASTTAVAADLAPDGLSAVACPSAARCTAVGSGVVAEEADGAWTASAVPETSTSQGWGGISCWAVASCVAVGSDGSGAGRLLAIDGSTVTTASITLPSGASGLSSVWCTSASACDATVVGAGAIERLSAGTWVTLAPFHAPFDDVLSGISCTTITSCVLSTLGGSVATEGTTTWRLVNLLVPGPLDAWLASVSCATPARCVAVGTYENVADEGRPFVATLAGAAWRAKALPVPPGTSQFDPSSVSCVETGCVIVGTELTTAGSNERAFVERSAGGHWTLSVLALPPGTSAAGLGGVDCRSATWCEAVGSTTTTSACTNGCTRPLVETLEGTTWHPAVLPYPQRTGSQAGLGSVSCWAVRACVAAGSSSFHGITESLDGDRWTSQTYPVPYPGDYDTLTSVSCVSGGVCRALGYVDIPVQRPPSDDVPILAEGHASHPMVLAQPWEEASWPANGISCTTAQDCTVVGYSLNGPAIVSVRTGSTWRTTELPLHPGSINVLLNAVDCTSPSACVGVGSTTLSASIVPVVASRT